METTQALEPDCPGLQPVSTYQKFLWENGLLFPILRGNDFKLLNCYENSMKYEKFFTYDRFFVNPVSFV